MKKIIVIILMLSLQSQLLSQFTFSDVAQMTWSEPEKKDRSRFLKRILGTYNGKHYVLHFGKVKGVKGVKRGYILKEYDENMVETGETQFALRFPNGQTRYMEDAYLVKDKVLIFSTYVSPEKENEVYLETIDLKKLSKDQRINLVQSHPVEKKRKSGSYVTHVSADTSHIMLVYLHPYERDEDEKFTLTVFDEKLEEKWSRSLSLEYKDNLFYFEDWEVDNQGNAWVLGKVSKELSRKERRSETNYEYHLLSYGSSDSYENDILFDPGKDNYVFDASISSISNGNIVCSSFYADYVKTAGMKGIYVMQLNPESGTIETEGTHDFEESFIEEFYSERQLEKVERKKDKGKKEGSEIGLPDFDLHSVIPDKDGGLMILSEDFELVIRTVTTYDAQGRPTTRTVYHYYYRDILSIRVSPSGEISWVKLLPKYQHTTNDGGRYSSFSVALKDDRVYLVYAETAYNNVWSAYRYEQMQRGEKVATSGQMKRSERKSLRASIPRKMRNNELLQVNWIDFNGNYKFNDPLMDLRAEEIRIRTYNTGQFKEDLLLYGIWGAKKMRMGLLKPY